MEFVFGWVILRLTKFKAKRGGRRRQIQSTFLLHAAYFSCVKTKDSFSRGFKAILGGLFLLPCRVVSKPQFPFSRPSETSKNHGDNAAQKRGGLHFVYVVQDRKTAFFATFAIIFSGREQFTFLRLSRKPNIFQPLMHCWKVAGLLL